jgi:hypothetical protein
MAATEESNPVDFMELHQVEIIFHTAASTKNLDMMMSLFADDASLSAGGKSYVGKDQVRSYFATVAGSFQPQNQWVAYTPAQRIRFEVNGDRATCISNASTSTRRPRRSRFTPSRTTTWCGLAANG